MTSSIPDFRTCSLYSETCCLGLREHYFSRIKSTLSPPLTSTFAQALRLKAHY